MISRFEGSIRQFYSSTFLYDSLLEPGTMAPLAPMQAPPHGHQKTLQQIPPPAGLVHLHEGAERPTRVTSSFLSCPAPTHDHISECLKLSPRGSEGYQRWCYPGHWTGRIRLAKLRSWELGSSFSWVALGAAGPSGQTCSRADCPWSAQMPEYQSHSRRCAPPAPLPPTLLFSSPSHILPEHVHSKCAPEFTLLQVAATVNPV